MAQKLNTRTSIVDYLKSQGQDSSMGARSKIANQHGIKNYSGTYNQNVTLLNKLRSGTSTAKKTTTTPKKTTTVPKKTTTTPKKTTTVPKKTTTTTTPAKTTTPKATTPKVTPSQQKQSDAQKAIDQAKKEYAEFLKGSKESFTEEQTALLDKAKTERLAELEKAYNEAVAQGEMSQEEAEKQLAEEQGAINEGAYLNSQITELSGEQRGVQNSQQLLAMQQGDQRHTQELNTEARSARDERINSIMDRINQITNSYNIDTATVNSAYNNDMTAMNARAHQMYNEGMQQMTMAEFKSQLEAKTQLSLMEQQQLDRLQQMETQQGYDLTKMDLQYNYDLGKMDIQHGFDLEKMDKQQGFDMTKLNTQQRHVLEQMAKAHGYDLTKMDIGQGYELEKMSVAHSYDMSVLDKQFGQNVSLAEMKYSHDMNMSEKEFNQAKLLAEHSIKEEVKAEKDRYKLATERELAKYTPGSIEYQIREGQLEGEHERILMEINARAMAEAVARTAGAVGGSYASGGDGQHALSQKGSGLSPKVAPNWGR